MWKKNKRCLLGRWLTNNLPAHRPKNLIYADEIIELKKTQDVAASS
jgi:hypothetical protein